jgi:hypothetical protein
MMRKHGRSLIHYSFFLLSSVGFVDYPQGARSVPFFLSYYLINVVELTGLYLNMFNVKTNLM